MRLRKGRLDLREVMDRALEDTRLALQERSHHLTYRRPPEPLWLTGDAERLQQIFHNLIENAIKYTEAGGTIEVLVEREPAPEAAEEPWAVVRVRDSGVGITREALPQIFDLFARAGQPLERSQGGLGIGLTMARHLVEMHGGTIEVFSAGPGKGSTFTVRLPVVQAIVPEAEKTPLEGQRTAELRPEVGKSRRVLVVEDNLDSARSLSDLLVIWGHQVRIAYEGPAALETALAFRPDVALVDIGLPGMNGYQLARLIRTQPTLKETLLVALTGYGQEEDRRQAEEAGFDRHFTKPIDLAELQVLVGQTPLAWRQRELQS
jgi:CheY-like chemotaxis protein